MSPITADRGCHTDGLWRAVDRLLEPAADDGVLAHKLGPLAACLRRRGSEPIPARFEAEERLARFAFRTAIPLLQWIREVADDPLIVLKGPEVASLYPDRARAFGDLDLLAVDAGRVHAALVDAGFVEVEDPELFREHHHLRPLQPPGLWLTVEIHFRPMLPAGVEPPVDEIAAAAVPSALGVNGLLAPAPTHHALMLAAHAWLHEPFRTLRDLIDVAAVAARADAGEIAETARAWGIERIWHTTEGAIRRLFGDGPQTLALLTFGRHLENVRERTVLENHLQRWLHSFWELPLRQAIPATAATFGKEILPEPGEAWGEKLTRVRHALRHPNRAMSAHTGDWRRDVDRRER